MRNVHNYKENNQKNGDSLTGAWTDPKNFNSIKNFGLRLFLILGDLFWNEMKLRINEIEIEKLELKLEEW